MTGNIIYTFIRDSSVKENQKKFSHKRCRIKIPYFQSDPLGQMRLNFYILRWMDCAESPVMDMMLVKGFVRDRRRAIR